jgi:hypothetical protein
MKRLQKRRRVFYNDVQSRHESKDQLYQQLLFAANVAAVALELGASPATCRLLLVR